jgi:hypothetical protein
VVGYRHDDNAFRCEGVLLDGLMGKLGFVLPPQKMYLQTSRVLMDFGGEGGWIYLLLNRFQVCGVF